jgi:hypothetical protein
MITLRVTERELARIMEGLRLSATSRMNMRDIPGISRGVQDAMQRGIEEVMLLSNKLHKHIPKEINV